MTESTFSYLDLENIMAIVERHIDEYLTVQRISDDLKEFVK